jgi:hypothetical protein
MSDNLVRSVLIHLPIELHSRMKNKTLNAGLTIQEAMTNIIKEYTNSTALDRVAGIKKK